MTDYEDLPREVEDLQQAQRDADREHDKLRADFTVLSNKLRYPGTKFLIDLEYKLVYDATVSANPGTFTISTAFETLPGGLHAVYHVSGYASDIVVVSDGNVIVPPTPSISICIQRELLTNPTRVEAKVYLYNSDVSAHSVSVRVWRRLGLGS